MTSPAVPCAAIYIDADDTLVPSTTDERISSERMVKRVRELAERGAGMYLWSRHGAEHARRVARELGIEGCFRGFLPKPEVLIDAQSLEDWSISEIHPVASTVVRLEDILRIERKRPS
jgi:predicted HAD superfamily phosphohydrolase YqeG